MVHRIRRAYRNGDRDRGRLTAGPLRRENSASRGYSQLLIAALLALWCVAASAAAPSISGKPPLKHVILLVHGATINGSRLNVGPFDLGDYFEGIPAFLGSSGTPVKIVNLSTDGTIEERAAVLKNFLDTDLKGQMVNVIAHSLGGLDVRYCISIMHTFQVASLTTIGTPHLGTPLADWAVDQMDNYGPWYWIFRVLGYDMSSRRFLREITTGGMKRFNEKVPDSPDVRYFSVQTRARFGEGAVSTLLWFPQHWLESRRHSLDVNGNDGLVPYDSQAWGTTVASSTELDHLGQMNHHELRFTSEVNESLRMYQSIYDTLQANGF